MAASLTPEEFAALVALDGSWQQRRPSPDMEIKLRSLGLIERSELSRLPARTAEGDALVAALKLDRGTAPAIVGNQA